MHVVTKKVRAVRARWHGSGRPELATCVSPSCVWPKSAVNWIHYRAFLVHLIDFFQF